MITKTSKLAILLLSFIFAVIAFYSADKETSVSSISNETNGSKQLENPQIQHIDTALSENRNSNTAVSEYSGALIELQMPSIELNGELSQHLARLLANYQQGDLSSGYILAMNLRRCANIPNSKDKLTSELSNIDKLFENGFLTKSKYAQHRQKLEETYYFCENVPTSIIDQASSMLINVGEQGYIPAQATYALITTPVDLSNPHLKLSSQQHDEIKHANNRHQQFLNNATQSGSILALSVAVNHYRIQTTQESQIKALGYNIALLELVKNDAIYKQQQQVRQTLEHQLNDEQKEQANILGKEVLSQIYKNGKVYRI